MSEEKLFHEWFATQTNAAIWRHRYAAEEGFDAGYQAGIAAAQLAAPVAAQEPTYRQALEAIAGGEGDAQEIARQTLAAQPAPGAQVYEPGCYTPRPAQGVCSKCNKPYRENGLCAEKWATLCGPAPAQGELPEFMVRAVERALADANNPKGMSLHDGYAKVPASILSRLLMIAAGK